MVATLLPVLFVVCLFGSIWGMYLHFHIANLETPLIRAPTSVVVPRGPGIGINTLMIAEETYETAPWALALEALQPATASHEAVNAARRSRARCQRVISQALILMFVICFVRTVLTHPGSVPASYGVDVHGDPPPASATSDGRVLPAHHEAKEQGGPRFCKWCKCYKPDRCHHCRVCGACVLRMDHHCPWVANCIGFRNHKYFLLLVVYAWLSAAYCGITMYESADEMFHKRLSTFTQRFALVLAMTLCVITLTLLSAFGGFHLWLLHHGATTIEFCEKAYKRHGSLKNNVSIYDRGLMSNLRAVLGPCVLTWLFPVMPPEGDGLSFPVAMKTLGLPGPSAAGHRRRTLLPQRELGFGPPLDAIEDERAGTDSSEEEAEGVPGPPPCQGKAAAEEHEPERDATPGAEPCAETPSRERRVHWAEG